MLRLAGAIGLISGNDDDLLLLLLLVRGGGSVCPAEEDGVVAAVGASLIRSNRNSPGRAETVIPVCLLGNARRHYLHQSCFFATKMSRCG